VALTWANEGADQLCGLCLGFYAHTPAWTLRLRSNNTAPANTDSNAGAQNTEVTATGYAAIALAGGTWAVSATYPKNGLGQYGYAQQTFTFTGAGAQTVYGYFITMVINAVTYLLGSELFGTSYVIPGGGGSLLITVTTQIGQR
jgi:hypothetical protein